VPAQLRGIRRGALGIRIGLNICEDIWRQAPVSSSRAAGAEVIIAVNGSPYQTRSQENREGAAAARAAGIRRRLVCDVSGG
jgi:predicted amidohydrolase